MWYEASLEELPSPLPGMGLSFLEAPYKTKAHQRFPGKTDFFLLSAGTCTFTQAGRVQLQLGAAAQDTASSSIFPTMDRTDMSGAHLDITDGSKGTLGCVHHHHTGDSPACHSHWWHALAALQANNLS